MKTVLLVESQRLVARDIQRKLSSLGYHTRVASARNAIRLARATGPDLGLVDIRLDEERDGTETAAALRKELDLPVVYLVARGDSAMLERAMPTQPLGYLVKPVRTDRLRSVLEA